MADATNPQAGVAPAAPSIDDRLSAFLNREPASPDVDETPPEAEPEAKPDDVGAQAEPTELTPEDIPDEDQEQGQAPTGDAFEIVHNGTQVKLNREETIKYAQQGFDYTRKTEAVAERTKTLDYSLQRIAEVEQIWPLVANGQAQVAAVKSQLDQYSNVDWVKLATDDPLEYPRHRARYDSLVNTYQSGVQQLTQAVTEIGRRRQEVTSAQLQQEAKRLRELVPEWGDQAKYEAGAKELSSYLVQQGADPQAVAGLSDALAVSIARKAMLYDRLLKSKGDKSKLLQSAPPVARPGVHQSRDSAKAENEVELRGRLKKTGDIKDAASLLMTRLK